MEEHEKRAQRNEYMRNYRLNNKHSYQKKNIELCEKSKATRSLTCGCGGHYKDTPTTKRVHEATNKHRLYELSNDAIEKYLLSKMTKTEEDAVERIKMMFSKHKAYTDKQKVLTMMGIHRALDKKMVVEEEESESDEEPQNVIIKGSNTPPPTPSASSSEEESEEPEESETESQVVSEEDTHEEVDMGAYLEEADRHDLGGDLLLARLLQDPRIKKSGEGDNVKYDFV